MEAQSAMFGVLDARLVRSAARWRAAGGRFPSGGCARAGSNQRACPPYAAGFSTAHAISDGEAGGVNWCRITLRFSGPIVETEG